MTVSPLGVEALDDPSTDPAVVRRMLRDISRANRWFGGRHAVTHGLEVLLDDADRGSTFTLLDIGTGAGDLPQHAERWAARLGVTMRSIGLERIPAAARLARATGMPVTLGCASALPVAERSVDIVLMSQVAHHLDRDTAAELFARCSLVARRGVIVADLRPSTFYTQAFRVGGALIGLHPLTVRDGATSVARGFTVAAMRDLVTRAGFPAARVDALPFARITAAWRTDR